MNNNNPQSLPDSFEEGKKLYIETYGCQMNAADSEVVASVMEMDGYQVTEEVKDADAIFINTCSIRDNRNYWLHGRTGQRLPIC